MITVTPMEKEILVWLSDGKTAGEIGEIIGRARSTVETHKQQIMNKFGAANVTSLVAAALRQGIIT
jgi:LuxR family quorum sensing-dependent transcriptional regulator